MDVEPIEGAAQGEEVPLAGGDVTEGVVRVGDTVRRPRGPWSSAVASYLHHLNRVGFPESPRYLGIDERGRDILQFIPGDVPSQPVVESWAAATSVLVGIADLLRRLPEASASFVPPADARWFGDDVHVDMPAGYLPHLGDRGPASPGRGHSFGRAFSRPSAEARRSPDPGRRIQPALTLHPMRSRLPMCSPAWSARA